MVVGQKGTPPKNTGFGLFFLLPIGLKDGSFHGCMIVDSILSIAGGVAWRSFCYVSWHVVFRPLKVKHVGKGKGGHLSPNGFRCSRSTCRTLPELGVGWLVGWFVRSFVGLFVVTVIDLGGCGLCKAWVTIKVLVTTSNLRELSYLRAAALCRRPLCSFALCFVVAQLDTVASNYQRELVVALAFAAFTQGCGKCSKCFA